MNTKRKHPTKTLSISNRNNLTDLPALKRTKKNLKNDPSSCYTTEERDHWIRLAAIQGMNQQEWETAIRYYACEMVEKSLTRKPWETCEMCRSEWAKIRDLLRIQAAPITDFRTSAMPAILHTMVRHKCKPIQAYEASIGKYPTLRGWRKAWRGESSFPPFVHLYLYSKDIRSKWAEKIASLLIKHTDKNVMGIEFLFAVIHDRRQCVEVMKFLKRAKTKEYGGPGEYLTNFYLPCLQCFCNSCGSKMQGRRFYVCKCVTKGNIQVCEPCYSDITKKTDLKSHHKGNCIENALFYAKTSMRVSIPQEHNSQPIAIELLSRLPAELCWIISQHLRKAHATELPVIVKNK